jgi:uncharacterized protein (TIGR02118 family)
MIKVAVLYPQSKKFDWAYYLDKHTPMLQQLMGSALKRVEIEKGIAGGAPGTAATYQTVCTLHFDSVESLTSITANSGGTPIRNGIPLVPIPAVT